jgi:iron complex outermembrane recepter protein
MQFNGRYSVRQSRQFKKRTISIIISSLLGFSMPMFANEALAETATASEFKKVYKISAGPLGNALTSFASQSGVVLSFDPSLTQGKQTVGLDGAYSLQAGFDSLLQGSDLVVVPGDSNGYLLKKVPKKKADGDAVLPEVTVTETSDAELENDSTKYLQRKATSTSRIPLTIKESPMTVTVVSKKLMDEFAVRDLSDAVKGVASVTMDNKNGGRQPALRSRGFLMDDTNAFMVDGQPMYALLDQPMELMESVEVLRGPSGVQYGRGRGSGIINLIRKRPTEDSFVSLKASGGSWDYKQLQLDAGGRVADHEHLGYRINVSKEDSNSFRDQVYLEKEVVGLVLDAQVNDDLKLTFLADYVNRDTPWDIGQQWINGKPSGVSRSSFDLLPWTAMNTSNTTLGYEVDWTLNEQWKVKHIYTFQDYNTERHISGRTGFNAATGNFTPTESRGVTDGKNNSFILDLIGDNTLFGMRHRTVVGYHHLDLDLETRSSNSLTYTGVTNNIYNPISVVRRPLTMSAFKSTTDSTYKGVYAEDYIGILPELNLMLGARYDKFEEKTATAAAVPVRDSRKNDRVTPRVGLVYTPIDAITLYGSYMRGFEPGARAGLTVATGIPATNAGELFDPQESEQYELGIKTSLLDDKLAINFAVYDLTRSNQVFTDLVLQRFTLVGEQSSKGFETEMIGQITPEWSVSASYAYLDTKVEDGANKGNQLNLAPRHSTRIWTSYNFTHGMFKDLSLYGGLFKQGDSYGDTANSFEVDGFTRFDAGASYMHALGQNKAIWRFNVDNITDRKYYMGNNQGSMLPGTPRNARLSLEVLF